MTPRAAAGAFAALAGIALWACGEDEPGAAAPDALPRGSEPVALDPADFTTTIDNPFLPLTPGDRRTYRASAPGEPNQRATATVTRRTKRVAIGVTARVVYTTVRESGELVEDNRAWYAQDGAGNVWYLGELARELDGSKVTTTKGSWEAGADGAQAGVIMPADPHPALAYREEYYDGVAEDRGEIFSLDERAQVPWRRFPSGVLLIKETEGIERSLLDYKFYARGVGLVLGVEISGGSGREELIGFHRG